MKNHCLRVLVIIFVSFTFRLAMAQNQSRELTDDSTRKGDGFIHLKGTVQSAKTNAHAVMFIFSGHLQFSFFTATYGDTTRKRVDMDFDMKRVPVSVPRFGKAEYDAESDAFIVSFRNAAKHALEVPQSASQRASSYFSPKFHTKAMA